MALQRRRDYACPNGGMLGWALRFLIAAILAMLLIWSDIGEGPSLVVKVVVGLLLGLCSVSLVAALRRPLK